MPKVMSAYYKSSVNTLEASQEPGPSSGLPARSARRRGRPRGNPTPLNEEQKKQRNAQYERERRNEAAEAMVDLQDAIGLDGRVSTNVIIGTALNMLIDHNTNPREDLNELRRINQSLEDQIAKLERIMAGNPNQEEDENDEDIEEDTDDSDDQEEQEEEDFQEADPIVEEFQEIPPQNAPFYDFDDNYYIDDEFYHDGALSEIVGLLE